MVKEKTVHTLSPIPDKNTIKDGLKTQFRAPVPTEITIMDMPKDASGVNKLVSFKTKNGIGDTEEKLYSRAKFIKEFSPFQMGETITFRGREYEFAIEVTGVKIERIFDIKREDIFREGFKGVREGLVPAIITRKRLEEEYYSDSVVDGWFINMWNATVKEEAHKWINNPYVFVYTFERTK